MLDTIDGDAIATLFRGYVLKLMDTWTYFGSDRDSRFAKFLDEQSES